MLQVAGLHAAPAAAGHNAFSPPEVRPPSALLADGADSKVFLEWNPNLGETLEGDDVYRAASGDKSFRRLTSPRFPIRLMWIETYRTAPEFDTMSLRFSGEERRAPRQMRPRHVPIGFPGSCSGRNCSYRESARF